MKWDKSNFNKNMFKIYYATLVCQEGHIKNFCKAAVLSVGFF